MTIEGKVQIVTGGTSGMGLSTAKALGQYGKVLVGGRSEKRIAEALDFLKVDGVDAYGMSVDISDRSSVRDFVKYATTLGEIGCVANAAGVFSDTASIDMIRDINVGGTINVTEEFLPVMQDGVLVLFSSVTGYFYQPGPEEFAVWANAVGDEFAEKWKQAVVIPEGLTREHLDPAFPYYASSKRFVMYYAMENAERFADKGNRVFSVAPGSYDTPMFRSGNSTPEMIVDGIACHRVGDPDEMGCLVAQLAGPCHDYLTGVDVLMDGGMLAMTIAPQLK